MPQPTADVGIVDLVRFAQAAGCRTLYSCQNDGPVEGRTGAWAYVAFADGRSLTQFVNAVAGLVRAGEDRGLLARVLDTPGLVHAGPMPAYRDCWRYEVQVRARDDEAEADLLFSVRIPEADLRLVGALLTVDPS